MSPFILYGRERSRGAATLSGLRVLAIPDFVALAAAQVRYPMRQSRPVQSPTQVRMPVTRMELLQ
jgi:hypothetical protein